MKTPRPLLHLAGLIAVLAALVAGVFAATPASAAPTDTTETSTATSTTAAEQTAPVTARTRCRIPRCYGAIVINPRTGGSAYSYNYPTRAKAIYAAKKRCRSYGAGSYCRTAVWVRNGCAAVAWRKRNGRMVEWAGRVAFNRAPAIRKAKRAVAGPGTEHLWTYVCTSRR